MAQSGGMSKVAPLKLLIVDDHAALRQTVRQLFDGPGVMILEASSGEEAVRLPVVSEACFPLNVLQSVEER